MSRGVVLTWGYIGWRAQAEIVQKRMKPWVTKKIVEYLGEEEATLIEFVLAKMSNHMAPQEILDQLAFVLEDEAEVFVIKLWRYPPLLLFGSAWKPPRLVLPYPPRPPFDKGFHRFSLLFLQDAHLRDDPSTEGQGARSEHRRLGHSGAGRSIQLDDPPGWYALLPQRRGAKPHQSKTAKQKQQSRFSFFCVRRPIINKWDLVVCVWCVRVSFILLPLSPQPSPAQP